MKTGLGERVFVVRMWIAGGGDSDAREWRGSILEVDSGRRVYVTGSRDIADFIDVRLADEDGKPA